MEARWDRGNFYADPCDSINSTDGPVIINLSTSFVKCLGLDRPVIMSHVMLTGNEGIDVGQHLHGQCQPDVDTHL